MVSKSLAGLEAVVLGGGGEDGGDPAGVGAIAAGAALPDIVSFGPRRKRMRNSPSRKSISVKSCRPISATNSLMVRMSKGPGVFEVSLATTPPATEDPLVAKGSWFTFRARRICFAGIFRNRSPRSSYSPHFIDYLSLITYWLPLTNSQYRLFGRVRQHLAAV